MIYFTGPFPFYLLYLLPNITVSVYIFKYKSGKVMQAKCSQLHEDGKTAKLMSVLANLPPAPDELLKIIKCNCHTDYSSMRCTCKKYNVKCRSSACRNCKGAGCTNLDTTIHEEDDSNTNTE